jgi:Flp pilus assembly protein TadG
MRRPKRLHDDERGSVAVEFAILAIPLFMTIFVIVECALQYFVGNSLDVAVEKAGRRIRTGQAIEQKVDRNTLKSWICKEIDNSFGCPSKLLLRVDVVGKITDARVLDPIDAAGNLKLDEAFDTGRSGDLVLVQAFLPWPSLSTFYSLSGKTTNKGDYVLRSISLFRNEPF